MIAVHHLEGAGISNSHSDKPLRTGKSWTDTEERELREMYASGKSMSEIADLLQRTRGSIRSRLVKLEIIDDFQAILDENRETRNR
jgi:DNA-binding NarL/FixJ family response regulator